MRERTSITPGPEGLRALSHPGRQRMLGLLRTDGPATATTLAARLGLNTGATSYHLRQLEKHGFVSEDTDRGNGRDRWWRASHDYTQMDLAAATTLEEHDSYDAYLQAVAIIRADQLQRALEERRLLPHSWQDASDLSDWTLWLTPERAKQLVEAVHALVEDFAEDGPDAAGAEPFKLNVNAFVHPGRVVTADEP
jgi:predicted ArsR family transcriptional regulator